MCLKAAQTKKSDYTLNQFESDLKSFYEFCKENQLSDEEIQKICEPLTKTIKSIKIPKYFQIFSILAVGLFIFYLLSYIDVIAWHYSAIGRIVLIKLLPIYDWRYLKNENCLIKFAKITPQNTTECTYCESIQNVRFEYDLDQDIIKERYLDMDVPIILMDALQNWPSFTKEGFIKEIVNDDNIYYSYPCKLRTNLRKNDQPIGKILEKALNTDSYFLHFENCDFDVMKAFRPFAPRPDYLHPEISPVQYNWLLMSKNYNVTKFKSLSLNERIIIFGQISGSNHLKLLPVEECTNECHVLEITLQRGESLIFTSLWDLEYKPQANSENVAVILETH